MKLKNKQNQFIIGLIVVVAIAAILVQQVNKSRAQKRQTIAWQAISKAQNDPENATSIFRDAKKDLDNQSSLLNFSSSKAWDPGVEAPPLHILQCLDSFGYYQYCTSGQEQYDESCRMLRCMIWLFCVPEPYPDDGCHEILQGWY